MNGPHRIVIATRGSALALWQAHHVRQALRSADAALDVELAIVRTRGDDALQALPRSALDKGLFTREIEQALLDRRADLAVHSLKDLPTGLPAGLTLAAAMKRADPADALVGRHGLALDDLPRGATVLTGSLRRRAQLLHCRPDLTIKPIRGNVATRLVRLDESAADAMVLAAAGLIRLDLDSRICQRLDPAKMVPACGQGALALEVRADDDRLKGLLEALEHRPTRLAVEAERAFLSAMGGGCQVPIGAYARFDDDPSRLIITGMVASLDGRELLRRTANGDCPDAQAAVGLGRQLAAELLVAGGRRILDQMAGCSWDWESGP